MYLRKRELKYPYNMYEIKSCQGITNRCLLSSLQRIFVYIETKMCLGMQYKRLVSGWLICKMIIVMHIISARGKEYKENVFPVILQYTPGNVKFMKLVSGTCLMFIGWYKYFKECVKWSWESLWKILSSIKDVRVIEYSNVLGDRSSY